jgi:hypothetical protein
MEILSVQVSSKLDQQLDILDLSLEDSEMQWCRLFTIRLINIHFKLIMQNDDRQEPLVGLGGTMHRREVVVHLGMDICTHLVGQRGDQTQFPKGDGLVNRLHTLAIPVGDQGLDLNWGKYVRKVQHDLYGLLVDR